MLKRALPREYALADQAFSQLCVLAADDEHLRIAFIRKSSDWCTLCSGHHCPAPAWCASSMADAETGVIEFSEPSFIIRQTLAREMQCFFAT